MNSTAFTIYYICHYVPMNRQHSDDRSKSFVLGFKGPKGIPTVAAIRKQKEAVHKAALIIYSQIPDNSTLVAIPPSNKDKNGIGAQYDLIKELIKIAPHKNFIDGSSCVYRHTSKIKSSEGGERSLGIHTNTITIRNTQLIANKKVVVLDDIVTTGASMKAVADLLSSAGASFIKCIAIGKTLANNDMKYGFIFDIDQTLFDTSYIEQYRKRGKWNEAIAMAENLIPMPGVYEILQKISLLPNSKITLVTNSVSKYADVFYQKLNLGKNPRDSVIAYHDVKNRKPHTDPYKKAVTKMEIFETFTVVFGDQDTDMEPALKMGMIAVAVNNPDARAHFHFPDMQAVSDNFDDIISIVDNVRNRAKYHHNDISGLNIKYSMIENYTITNYQRAK